MSYRFIFCLAAGLCIALRPSASWALVNGGFEAGTVASGWAAWNPDNKPLTWGVTSNPTKVHSGTYAGALTAFAGNTNSTLTIFNVADVSAWPQDSMCRATVWLKTENLQLNNPKDTFRMVVAVLDPSGSTVLGYYSANGNFLGTQDYMPVECFLTLPHGAGQVWVELALNSGIVSGSAYIDDVDFQLVASLGGVSTNLPVAAVKPDTNGTPRFSINGVSKVPSFFFGNTGNPVIYDEMKLATSAAVDIVQVPINLPWQGLGTGMLEQSLKANSNALFLPRIDLTPPDWWKAENTNAMIVDEVGGQISGQAMPSLASDAFIAACKDQLEKFIRYFHNSPYRSRILGYHTAFLATGEWFYPDMNLHYWDYSEVNRLKFIAWLQTNYASIGALNTAWHKSYASFAVVQIPSSTDWTSANDGVFRDPSLQRAVPDYAQYHNNLVADRIAELAAHIKTLTARKSLTLTFYGYLGELTANGGLRGMAHSGHLGLKRLLTSTNVDMICSPFSYFDRQPGGPANLMSVVDTVSLAGKLYLQENDSNTYVVPPSNANPLYSTEWDALNCYRRDYGNVLAHNQATWWMDLYADGRLNTNSLWINNALLIGTSSNVLAKSQVFEPQVAICYDEETFFWLTANSFNLNLANIYQLRSTFQSLGATVGYYLIEDLAQIPASAKLIVFANTHRLDSAEQALISQAKTNGRTFLWLYAPGYVNETSLSVSGMATATGFTFVKNATAKNPAIKIVTGSTSPIAMDLGNVTFGDQTAISPTFYVSPVPSGADTLGNYTSPTSPLQPALVAKDYGTWKSVFCGAPKPSVTVLRSIARYAGVNLLADADTISITNAVNFIGDYMYAYAISNAGRHCLQIPGEKVANGNFEKFTGALPITGFGRWISPSSGTLPACRVVNTNAAAGSNSCATGPFSSIAAQYSEPLAIRLQAQRGKTYQVSCSVYVDGLNAASAVSGSYIYLSFQPHTWTADSWTAAIADGSTSYLANKTWTRLEGGFTFNGVAAPYENELDIILKVYGAYSAGILLIDNVSVRESGCAPVEVFDLTKNVVLGSGVTSWAADFALNEQKIFRLIPISTPPGFTKGADQSVLEDSGPATVVGWATGISPGPAGESWQIVTFVCSNSNAGMFAAQPAVTSSGTLTYTTAANANGTATVTVWAVDNGGTANGGQDTSAPQTFTVTVTAVNDAPSFTKGPDIIVNEDAGAQSFSNWATNLNRGALDEATQSLSFTVTNGNSALFSAPPAINSSGTLTFTPEANAFGSASVGVRMTDTGGTANGGQNTSAWQTFLITVNPVNDLPVAGADTVFAHWNTTSSLSVSNLLSNDSDPDGGTLAVTAVTPGPNTAAVVLSANTVFYTPMAGFAGNSAFTYLLSDGQGGQATGEVSVVVVKPEITAWALLPGDLFRLEFQGLPNTAYRLQASTNLTTWFEHSTNSTAGNGRLQYDDATAPASAIRFYRFVWP